MLSRKLSHKSAGTRGRPEATGHTQPFGWVPGGRRAPIASYPCNGSSPWGRSPRRACKHPFHGAAAPQGSDAGARPPGSRRGPAHRGAAPGTCSTNF